MTTITIEKGTFTRKHFIDKNDLFIYVIECIEDMQDFENVKNEIKNGDGYRIDFDNYLKNV